MTKLCAALLASVAILEAAPATWLDKVLPIITASEKKTYLALPPEGQTAFQDNFWSTRSITAEEYYRRLSYIDSMFGSSKTASGANTDPGRVYLSLGPPTRLTKLPSSRTFVPLEIWYYDSVPGVVSTELRLMFFRPNSMGLPKLYSPITDTLRALLVPQSATTKAFGPNDSITEADARKVLKGAAGEDEVLTAASGIAPGIKGNGNQEILALVTSPEAMLSKSLKPKVTARLVSTKAQLETFLTPSMYGGTQVDFRVRTPADKEIAFEIRQSEATLLRNNLQLHLAGAKLIDYTHRLDLLPGSYQILFTADGNTAAFPLEIPDRPRMSEIVRADLMPDSTTAHTPFEFDGLHYDLVPQGKYALVALPQAGRITWLVRKGSQVVWRNTTQTGLIELPTSLPPGEYRLEAVTDGDSRSAPLTLGASKIEPEATAVSYNANLAPALRYAFIGQQWLLRNKLPAARMALEASLREGKATDIDVTFARLEALEGKLDAARDRVRAILAANPNHFEALTVFAFIETQLQDFPVAAQLYKRALALQDSPALRTALASLPGQN